jgi:DNA-binding response OmpR family regulator
MMINNVSNVLIIDDDRETLAVLKLALKRKGFFAFTAANWDEITTQLERAERLDKEVDVIILDIMMPERSGFDIFRALQVVLHPLPPVIMLSAVTGIDQQIQSRDLGASKYITKPTTPTKLIRAIKEVLSQKG